MAVKEVDHDTSRSLVRVHGHIDAPLNRWLDTGPDESQGAGPVAPVSPSGPPAVGRPPSPPLPV